jgi:hypothetical protein
VKKKYTLFLDESETHIHNKDYHFCMAGAIIAEDDYPILEDSIKQLKRNVWPDRSNPEEIILHQMRIIDAEKGRLNHKSFPEYSKFNKKSERVKFYNELKRIFVDNNIIIVGSSICEDDLKNFYWVSGKNKQDQYLVAMQLLLENYCHFLCTNNGIGNIIYEYRELKGNEMLRDKYYHMKLMGSMYMNKDSAEKHLLGIDFVNKDKNLAGLQVADFIPNSFARHHAKINQAKPNIFSTLQYCRYDGNQNCKDRFGIKYMP